MILFSSHFFVTDVNKTLSSTLKVVLRQVRVPIPQSKILQREYRKRELVIPFLSGLYLS